MPTPKETKEEMPSFFLPSRNKLFAQLVTDTHNCKRFARKPIPQAEKDAFTKHAKEYAAYKLAEKTLIDQEEATMTEAQMKALDALIFLPDYLMDETLQDSGE
jgi:TfoX/Sxy family transcriptional regulator of competence genes